MMTKFNPYTRVDNQQIINFQKYDYVISSIENFVSKRKKSNFLTLLARGNMKLWTCYDNLE